MSSRSWTDSHLFTRSGEPNLSNEFFAHLAEENGGHRSVRRQQARATDREYHRNLKLQTFRHYSGCEVPKCAMCGFDDIRALDLHRMKGQAPAELADLTGHELYLELKKRGYPVGYRVLCSSCNNERASRGKPTPLKLEIIKILSPEKKCARCPETNPWRLTVNHKLGGGRKHTESLVENGEIRKTGAWYIPLREELRDKKKRALYEILCWNCQRIDQETRSRYHLDEFTEEFGAVDSNIFRKRAEETSKLESFHTSKD